VFEGNEEGKEVGIEECSFVGETEETLLGDCDVLLVGTLVGHCVGICVGTNVGLQLGVDVLLGACVGQLDGGSTVAIKRRKNTSNRSK
jgi:hypothetical protein